MLTRRQVLGVSVIAAGAAHLALIALSPRLPILQARSAPAKEYSFSVRVVDDVPPPPPAAPPEAMRERATAPGDMSELLERETESLTPAESLLEQTVEVPNVDERVASDPIDREYSLEPNPDVLSRLDAKILEISQEVARDDIQVARREVAPSSNRLVGENEFPVLRSPLEDSPAEVLTMEPSFTPLSAVGPLQDGAPVLEMLEKPPVEIGMISPTPEEGLPAMPEEIEVARAPVLEEVKQENVNEFMDDLVEIHIDTYVPPGEKEGYFRVRMVPRANQTQEVLPKDITYVIDASNSILQRKLDKTIAGVARAVQMLRPEDMFNIVIFRDSTTSFRQERVPATPENVRDAIAFLKGQESKGQTDVYRAMVPVVESQTRRGVPGMVVVLSDGRPTTGVRDGRTIINALTDENNDNKSIFAIGGGNTVNRYLLDLLAYRNKGESFVAQDFSTLDQDLPRVLASVNDPLLTELNAEYVRVNEDEVFPKEVPDFFRDKPVTVYGRFNPAEDKEFAMRLAGLAQDKTKEVIFQADLEKAPKGDATIARNWAFQKIYYLIGEICRVGEKPELLAELRELSRTYNIRTSYSD